MTPGDTALAPDLPARPSSAERILALLEHFREPGSGRNGSPRRRWTRVSADMPGSVDTRSRPPPAATSVAVDAAVPLALRTALLLVQPALLRRP